MMMKNVDSKSNLAIGEKKNLRRKKSKNNKICSTIIRPVRMGKKCCENLGFEVSEFFVGLLTI